MHVAAMLHIAILYLNKKLTPIERILNFFTWYAKNLLVCKYIIVYILMLFTNQEGIRPSKNINNKDINTVFEGCKNQAWDFTYLSLWSGLYSREEELGEIFYFATADKMLKRIIINTHGPRELEGLVEAILCKEDAEMVARRYNSLFYPNRIRPDFGIDSIQYCNRLIEQEKKLLIKEMNS